MASLINIALVAVLAVLGYFIGGYLERRHFRSIREREARYQSLMTFTSRTPPPGANDNCTLVAGNVVISIDYFKRLAAGLRGIVGGRVGAYETLVDRARREAVLRMKEDARQKNVNLVFGVRLETSSISKGASKQLGMVEVYAYGTGVFVNPE